MTSSPWLSPAQCRAARALLGMTQDQLAVKSGVSKRAIVAFELGQSTPIRNNLAAIQGALEQAGVEFTGRDGVRRKPPA
jgi:transcriptional regulator with XRE-family HTH domain